MKRAIVFGIGGIGGYMGARIASGDGVETTFVARGAHLAAIQASGLVYRTSDGVETIVKPTLATDDPAKAGKADAIFLCVKGYDLDGACKAILPCVSPDTVVVPLLNGADIHDRVRKVVKEGVVLPAAIYIASTVAGPGVVNHGSGKGNLVLGVDPDKRGFNPAPLKALLDRSGIPYEWFDDPMPAIWTKYLFIASFALATGRSGLDIGGVIADPAWAKTVKEIQAELAALAKAKGVSLPADAAAQAFEKGKAFASGAKTSYQRDLEKPGKPNEGELFGGTIQRLGRELGVPTPVSDRVYAEIEAGRRG